MHLPKTISFTFLFIFYTLGGIAQKDWKISQKTNDYTLWLKDVPYVKVKQFKIQTKINENIEATFRLLRDVENMHLWYDKVKSVKLLKKISAREAIYLLEYDLPFPFKDRISTIKGSIDFDQNAGKINVSTVYYPYTIPDDKKHLLLITKIAGGWDITKSPNETLTITHHGYLDPEGSIPAWLVNEGVTSGPLKTIAGLKRRVKSYKS